MGVAAAGASAVIAGIEAANRDNTNTVAADTAAADNFELFIESLKSVRLYTRNGTASIRAKFSGHLQAAPIMGMIESSGNFFGASALSGALC